MNVFEALSFLHDYNHVVEETMSNVWQLSGILKSVHTLNSYIGEFRNALDDTEQNSFITAIGTQTGGITQRPVGPGLLPAMPDYHKEADKIFREWLVDQSQVFQPKFDTPNHNLTPEFLADWPPPYWKIVEYLHSYPLPQRVGPREILKAKDGHRHTHRID
jgi:hypothetical protein